MFLILGKHSLFSYENYIHSITNVYLYTQSIQKSLEHYTDLWKAKLHITVSWVGLNLYLCCSQVMLFKKYKFGSNCYLCASAHTIIMFL